MAHKARGRGADHEAVRAVRDERRLVLRGVSTTRKALSTSGTAWPIPLGRSIHASNRVARKPVDDGVTPTDGTWTAQHLAEGSRSFPNAQPPPRALGLTRVTQMFRPSVRSE